MFEKIGNWFQSLGGGGTVEDSAYPNGTIDFENPEGIKPPEKKPVIDFINNQLGAIRLPVVETSNEIAPKTLNPILMLLGGGILLFLIFKFKKS